MGVCLESDICEERLLELKIPLTKLPRRRAVRDHMDECVIGFQVCVGLGDVTKMTVVKAYSTSVLDSCMGKGRVGIIVGGERF